MINIFIFCILLAAIRNSYGNLKSSLSIASFDGEDLHPYISHHGPTHGNRFVRDCQNVRYGNMTHSKHKAHVSDHITLPVVHTSIVIPEVGLFDKRDVLMHHHVISNPLQTFSVLEPLEDGACQNDSVPRATVMDSARRRQCLVAANGGYFNTHNGECYGNVISDGRLAHDSDGIQNAHFGITQDGHIYIGYLSEIDILAQDFQQLVGGVLWLIRDGEIYLAESIQLECDHTEETGSLEYFANVMSARTAVGHDKEGHVIMVEVNGQTGHRGMSLWEFSDELLKLGLVNAINLDGGGSTTVVINGTLVNYPSDKCEDQIHRCARMVSTILCVHTPECDPRDCSGHGSCELGMCNCTGQWSGQRCDRLKCPEDCSSHGICQEDGCECDAGWMGSQCNDGCPEGTYGDGCMHFCACQNQAKCAAQDGTCICLPGYHGERCEWRCPYGRYGPGCSRSCYCGGDCPCDHVTGKCNQSMLDTDLIRAGKCLALNMISKQNLVPEEPEQYRLCLWSTLILSIVAALSISLNLMLVHFWWNLRQQNRKSAATVEEVINFKPQYFGKSNSDNMFSDDNEEINESTALMETSFSTVVK